MKELLKSFEETGKQIGRLDYQGDPLSIVFLHSPKKHKSSLSIQEMRSLRVKINELRDALQAHELHLRVAIKNYKPL